MGCESVESTWHQCDINVTSVWHQLWYQCDIIFVDSRTQTSKTSATKKLTTVVLKWLFWKLAIYGVKSPISLWIKSIPWTPELLKCNKLCSDNFFLQKALMRTAKTLENNVSCTLESQILGKSNIRSQSKGTVHLSTSLLNIVKNG